jgi:polyribonucleotide nucleotidyltransferase
VFWQRTSLKTHKERPVQAPYAEESIPCSGKEPGRIIGKGGATINRIQDATGARIDVMRDEQQCVVTGSASAVAAALDEIRLIMSEVGLLLLRRLQHRCRICWNRGRR